jgi:hypothetical protein
MFHDFKLFDRVKLVGENFSAKWSYAHLAGEEGTIMLEHGKSFTHNPEEAVIVAFDNIPGHYSTGKDTLLDGQGGWVIHSSDIQRVHLDNESYFATLPAGDDDPLPSIE